MLKESEQKDDPPRTKPRETSWAVRLSNYICVTVALLILYRKTYTKAPMVGRLEQRPHIFWAFLFLFRLPCTKNRSLKHRTKIPHEVPSALQTFSIKAHLFSVLFHIRSGDRSEQIMRDLVWRRNRTLETKRGGGGGRGAEVFYPTRPVPCPPAISITCWRRVF